MLTVFVLQGYESFDGAYKVKDQVKIEGKTYYRIGKDGLNDIVVNVDRCVITWDLAIDATKEWFIEDTIEQLVADGEIARDMVRVEYMFQLERKNNK